jgi:DNA polymerase III alpha subunit
LSAIKHVGHAAIESLLARRAEGGPFASLEDFAARADWASMNKRVLESLARCGALDCLGVERGRILAGLDRIVAFGTQLQRSAAAGQATLFGEVEAPAAVLQLGVSEPSTIQERIEWEQELLGVVITRHPVSDAAARFREVRAVPVSEVGNDHANRRIGVGGMIRSLRSFTTKDGRPMATMQITDLQSSLEVVIFSRSYEQVQDRLVEGAIVVVDGKLDAADGRVRMMADGVFSLDEAAGRPVQSEDRPFGRRKAASDASMQQQPEVPAGPPRRITIELFRGGNRAADVDRVTRAYEALQRYRGHDEAEMVVVDGGKRTRIPLPNATTGYCDKLATELNEVLGESAWRVEEIRASA